MLVNEEGMKKLLMNVYEDSQDRLNERNKIIEYYSFYSGAAEEEALIDNDLYKGQSWKSPDDLDFKPSKDIRNHTKKLIQKQGRFMFGETPNLMFKPFNKEDKDSAEAKRMFIDTILEDMEFWSETYKAFIDSTIGKRVLMTVIANPGEPIGVRYYRSDCFSYKTDPMDYKKITEVIIAFQDESTDKAKAEDQVWNRYKYNMDGDTCKLETSVWNGNGEMVGEATVKDTKFKRIPCRVILNGGLLGDGMGTSDIEDLMDLANAYNRLYSDFRDALRFKMFEQPVLINASEESVDSVKIAPNALIDLKSDPSTPDRQADAKMLSSTFSFQDAAKTFLEGTKGDMYELMDQPRPEDIRNVPSAKAIKFVFYDLMSRCKDKWKAWGPAIKWAVTFMEEAIVNLNLYKDEPGIEAIGTQGRLVIEPCYPIPEDEETTKTIAMKEVDTQVMSRKTYIRKFSDVEDEDGEFNEILDEAKSIKDAEADNFETNDPNDGTFPTGGKGAEE